MTPLIFQIPPGPPYSPGPSNFWAQEQPANTGPARLPGPHRSPGKKLGRHIAGDELATKPTVTQEAAAGPGGSPPETLRQASHPSDTRGRHNDRSSRGQEEEEAQPEVAENSQAGWQGSSGRRGASSPGLHLSGSPL